MAAHAVARLWGTDLPPWRGQLATSWGTSHRRV